MSMLLVLPRRVSSVYAILVVALGSSFVLSTTALQPL